MPTTTLGIEYPASTAHTRLWEHYQTMADDIDTLINARAKGIIARGKRTTNSTGTTSEIGVLRLDDVPIKAGRAYKVWTSPLHADGSVNGDIITGRLRYTTDGSTPGTGSTLLQKCQGMQDNNALASETRVVIATYTPATDQTFSVLLTCFRASGSGTVIFQGSATEPIELIIEDVGIDPGDTGTDI